MVFYFKVFKTIERNGTLNKFSDKTHNYLRIILLKNTFF